MPYHDDDEDDEDDMFALIPLDEDDEGDFDLVPLDGGFRLSDKTTVAHTNLETSLNCDDESKYDDDDDKGDEYTGGW